MTSSRASKIGDVLRFRLAVGRIGTSSIQLKFEVRHGEEVRVRAKLTVVRASLDTFKAVPISQDLRRRSSGTGTGGLERSPRRRQKTQQRGDFLGLAETINRDQR